MANSTDPSRLLLRRILVLLLQQFGSGGVRKALSQAEKAMLAERGSDISATSAPSRGRTTYRRPTATHYVLKAKLAREKRFRLLELASLFDQKLFLPSAGDIRHFMQMNDQKAPEIKRRADAFPRVLEILAALPIKELDRLLVEKAHSGPSRLGPLSDAIQSAGEAISEAETRRK